MTEQAKHTPGPWHVGRGKGRGWYIDTEREHLSIHYPVADFVYVDADARLIAAAPDLLEAAKAFVDGDSCIKHNDYPCVLCEIGTDWSDLRAAIAKAEGTDLHAAAE